MLGLKRNKLEMPAPEQALPGRTDRQMRVAEAHTVLGKPMKGPWPEGIETASYLGGYTPNPTYEEVCSGLTGHNEVVLVAFDPRVISYGELLKVFFENHNPTQGMRQGGDIGTQYRSGLYATSEAQKREAEEARASYAAALAKAGLGPITTEILPAGPFYYAEDYHQQYLDKNPQGYCGLGGTGVACQVGAGVTAG